jgi:hypothetical protein
MEWHPVQSPTPPEWKASAGTAKAVAKRGKIANRK